MSASGSIYDLGYQHYTGSRLGRWSVGAALLRMTLRAAYGIGRGGRAKIVPFGLAGLALLPAVLAVGIAALVSQAGPSGEVIEDASPIQHETYQGLTSLLVMLFCAAQAPELFGKDQRYNVLPLFFSRSLGRADYALARLGGLFLAVLVLTLTPHLVLFVGALLAAPDPAAGLADESPLIPGVLAITLLSAALLAGVAGVIAAWTPRRAYATAAIIAAFIIPPIIVALTAELAVGDLARALILLSPGDVLDGANAAIFGTIADNPAVSFAQLPAWSYVAATAIGVAGSIALLLRRYLSLTV
jgi:ABC-2 type transport system permease protein